MDSATTSKFRCADARREYWDLFTITGGYSPRNEVYQHAIQFVDMWRKLMGNTVQPYSEYRYCRYVYAPIYKLSYTYINLLHLYIHEHRS